MSLCTLLYSVWLGLYTHLAICKRCFEALKKKANVYGVYAVTCASASPCVCVNICTKCMCMHAYNHPRPHLAKAGSQFLHSIRGWLTILALNLLNSNTS